MREAAQIPQEDYLFKRIYKRISSVANRFYKNSFWYACRELWVHGTKLPTLIMMQKIDKRLWSSGNLLKKGIAPLCGEVCGSHNSTNKEKLSGEILDSTFEDKTTDHYMDAGTKLLVSVLYASQKQYYGQVEMVYNQDETWKLVSIEVIKENLKNENKRALKILPIHIMRLRLTDPNANEKLEEVREFLKTKKYKALGILEALEAIEKPLPFCLDEEDIKKMAEPYPILFGCPDQDFNKLTKVGSEYCEYLNQDGLQLGLEIQMAFTESENLDSLRQFLQEDDVQVETMEMAYLLETMEMLRGDSIDPQLIQYRDLSSAQFQISSILQRDILPYYAALLPEDPVYENCKGERHKVPDPFYGRCVGDYKEYIEGVTQKGNLPRDIHGTMHAARVTFLTVMQMALFGEGTHPILTAVAAGFHDSRRQDEGMDRYEGKSAANLRAYLKLYNLSDEIIEIYVRAVRDKDPISRQYVDNVQRMVHNADCWEILRLMGLNRFRFGELHFEGLNLDNEFIHNLTLEVKKFIDQTEDIEIKRKLEWESDNFYLDLLRLFLDTHTKENCYPLMMKLMEKPLAGLR